MIKTWEHSFFFFFFESRSPHWTWTCQKMSPLFGQALSLLKQYSWDLHSKVHSFYRALILLLHKTALCWRLNSKVCHLFFVWPSYCYTKHNTLLTLAQLKLRPRTTPWLTNSYKIVISWRLGPRQPVGIISALETNSIPSLSYSAHKSLKTNHNFPTAWLKYFTTFIQV